MMEQGRVAIDQRCANLKANLAEGAPLLVAPALHASPVRVLRPQESTRQFRQAIIRHDEASSSGQDSLEHQPRNRTAEHQEAHGQGMLESIP